MLPDQHQDSDPAHDAERLGPFLLLERLGQGGMGAVFRGRHEESQEEVALKVLKDAGDDPSLLERFKREGRLLAELDHPGIVGLRGELSVSGGQAYYAMELVEGQDLRQVLRAQGALPPEEAVRIAREVLAALAYAHARDVVHRDVKPPNVLLDPSGRARLADFGLARVLESSGLTRTGTVLGTPEYMAPEQAEGHPSEARTDLYAVGILLFELVSGAPPFRAERPLAILRAHCEAPVPPLRAVRGELPAGLEGIVRRALAKAPADRWPSAEAMGAALSELSLSDLPSSPDETRIEGPPGGSDQTTPLPQLDDSGRGSAPAGSLPISAAAMHAETTLEEPPLPQGQPDSSASPGGAPPSSSDENSADAPSPEEARSTRRPLVAVLVLGLLLVPLGFLAARAPAPEPNPPPSRGAERDWGILGAPGEGASEEATTERMDNAAWDAEARGAWREVALISAGIELRSQDGFARLRARGRAVQAVAALGSPAVLARSLEDAEALSLSPTGDLAAQALKEGGILLTPLAGPARRLGETPRLSELKFSPEGRYLAAAPWINRGVPRPIEIWDLKDDRLVARLDDGEHATRHLAWSPDGAWLVSGSASPEDGLLVWDARGEGTPLRCPANDMRIHVQPTWSPDGARLMFASTRGGFGELASGLTLIPFEPQSARFGRVRTIERGHAIATAAWSPDGSMLAVGGAGDPISKDSEYPRTGQGALLHLKRGRWSKLSGHSRALAYLSWSPDGSRLVSSDAMGLTQCWAVSPEGKLTLEGSLQGGLEVPSGVRPGLPTLAWAPDSAFVVGAGPGSGVAVWNGRGPWLQALYPPLIRGPIRALRWSSPKVLRVLTDSELSARPIRAELFDLAPGALLDLCEERAGKSVGALFPRKNRPVR